MAANLDAIQRFEGLRGRALYLATSLAVFFSQHLAVLVGAAVVGARPTLAEWFWIDPFRAVLLGRAFGQGSAWAWLMPVGMAATCAADALLVWLAFRRGRWTRAGGWIAALAVVPVLQLGVMAWLTVCPDDRSAKKDKAARDRLNARTAVQGLLAGTGMIVAAVALSTLVFGLYGYVLFVVSPFLIAVVVGYLANRRGSIGGKATFGLVVSAFLLGGATLLGFALEGVLCLVLATPLIAIMGGAGAALGVALAGLGRPRRATMLSGVAVLPLLLAGEAVLPPRAAFESVEFVDVAAPPSAVWDAVVHMGPIPDAPAAPFRWGLAYPLRGEILGTGVGAIRRGVFSTGIAYERVTGWRPGRQLSFIVLSDPPTMRELSPYAHLNAPHSQGYFRTLDARFTLTPLAGGRTRLALATRHELDLEPALYWTPLVRWAVRANKVRVLVHFKAQAEASIARRPVPSPAIAR